MAGPLYGLQQPTHRDAGAQREIQSLVPSEQGAEAEIGDAENISKGYVSRILRLALLAPDIIEAILAGRTDQALMLEELERPLLASWEEQRRKIFPTSDTIVASTAELVGSPTPPSPLG